MEPLKAIFWIYRTAFLRSLALLGRNWGVIFAPVIYGLLLSLAAVVFSPFWLIGGMLLTAVAAACASSGLYLIENIVRGGKIDLNDFIKGFPVYVWEILGIAFILWIPMTLLSRVAYTTPEGPFIVLAVRILLYIILNPVPELIYQSRISGLALLSASYEFIVANWIEWFLPNVLIAAAFYLLTVWLNAVAAYMPVFVQSFLIFSAFGLLLAFLMIFRGVLFSDLNGTTRRSRLFRYRAQASRGADLE
ncbi:MAG: hypothetical protein HY695_29790 [Deltaproteobacteria bacterium]|nr:hypothetical protein [Deltaproteobacteria bacterium]